MWSTWASAHSNYSKFLPFSCRYLTVYQTTFNLMPFSCTPSDSYDQSALQAVQLEDGTTAYIHHAVQVPQSDTILAIQADGTVAGLHTGDATIDPDTISALEQYAAKVQHFTTSRTSQIPLLYFSLKGKKTKKYTLSNKKLAIHSQNQTASRRRSAFILKEVKFRKKYLKKNKRME